MDFRPPEVDLSAPQYPPRVSTHAGVSVGPADGGGASWQVGSGESWDSSWDTPSELSTTEAPHLDRTRPPVLGAPHLAGAKADPIVGIGFEAPVGRALPGSFTDPSVAQPGFPDSYLGTGGDHRTFPRGSDLPYAADAGAIVYGEVSGFEVGPRGDTPARQGAPYMSGKPHLRPDVTPFSPGQVGVPRLSAPSGVAGATHWSSAGSVSHTDWNIPAPPPSRSSLPAGGGLDVSTSPLGAYSPNVSPLDERRGSGLGFTGARNERVSGDLPIGGAQWTAVPHGTLPPSGAVLDGWGNEPGGHDLLPQPQNKGGPAPPVFGDVWSQPPQDNKRAEGYDDGDEKFYDALLAEDTDGEGRAARSSQDEFLSGVLRGMDF